MGAINSWKSRSRTDSMKLAMPVYAMVTQSHWGWGGRGNERYAKCFSSFWMWCSDLIRISPESTKTQVSIQGHDYFCENIKWGGWVETSILCVIGTWPVSESSLPTSVEKKWLCGVLARNNQENSTFPFPFSEDLPFLELNYPSPGESLISLFGFLCQWY